MVTPTVFLFVQGIVRKPCLWKWSSAGVHVRQGYEGINLENITTLIDTTAEEWKEYIDLDEKEEVENICCWDNHCEQRVLLQS